jgi:23S rRNA (cytidine1920-2'-O)/16S rRNA (cytidine1409-2'-O)-methyltransferase
VELIKASGEILALIKPQFEAGKEKVGKKGVVRDPAVHKEVILKVLNLALILGLKIKGLDFSPITGPEGNIEYLAYLVKDISGSEATLNSLDLEMVNTVVTKAHQLLS